MKNASIWKKYGFMWVTLTLFLVSLAGHWALAWSAYRDDQLLHGRSADVAGYLVETGRDTLENWQSEFLQLVWQVAGLAILFHVGSPQSKEGDERKEEKLDRILEAVAPERAAAIIKALGEKYPQ
jgi:hypothetical protein